jgi:phosphatidylglycerol---prolipoprotein diacylglyceryl transferase
MYVVGIVLFVVLGRMRARQNLLTGWHPRDVDDMVVYGVLGVVLGGRLGYVLFYKLAYYLAHPVEILELWQGGMSFHGGFLGVLIALWLYSRRYRKRWLDITDFVAPLVPLGLAAGRLGNFINGELWGRKTDVPWAMIFPQVDAHPRHPSQLYEFGLEGVLLFVILWLYASRPRPLGAVSAVFLISYGVFRFLVEFTREPDSFLGLLAFGLSMGQWLSLPMIIGGVLMLAWAYARERKGPRSAV